MRLAALAAMVILAGSACFAVLPCSDKLSIVYLVSGNCSRSRTLEERLVMCREGGFDSGPKPRFSWLAADGLPFPSGVNTFFGAVTLADGGLYPLTDGGSPTGGAHVRTCVITFNGGYEPGNTFRQDAGPDGTLSCDTLACSDPSCAIIDHCDSSLVLTNDAGS